MNDKHKGIIYKSPSHWGIRATRFIVTKQLDNIGGEIVIQIKLLDFPDYISMHFFQPGYARIRLKSLEDCIIVEDNRNITEYLKARLLL
jgi:hypothetical protein